MCAQGTHALRLSGLYLCFILFSNVVTSVGTPSTSSPTELPEASPAAPPTPVSLRNHTALRPTGSLASPTLQAKALSSSVAEEENYLVDMVDRLNSTSARQMFSSGVSVVAKISRRKGANASGSNVIRGGGAQATDVGNESAEETSVEMTAGVVDMLSERAGGDDMVAVLSTIDESSLPGLDSGEDAVVKAVAFSLFRASDKSRVAVSHLEAPVALHMGATPPGSTCHYWDEDREMWSQEGVRTSRSGDEVTCLASHLSVFSLITNRSLVQALHCIDTSILSHESIEVMRSTNWYWRPAAWLLFTVVFVNLGSFLVAEFYDIQRSRHYGLQKAVPESFFEQMSEELEDIIDAWRFMWRSLISCSPSTLMPGVIVKCTRHTGSTFVNLNRKDMTLLRRLYRKHKKALENGTVKDEHLERVHQQQNEFIDLVGKLLVFHSFIFSKDTPYHRRFIVFLWAERPWASTWEFNYRMSKRAQAMLRMCLMVSSLFKTALLFNASGTSKVDGPSLCSNHSLGERIAKIVTFSIISALLSPVVALFFTRIAQIGVIRKAARQHHVVEFVKLVGASTCFWILVVSYVSFCVLFVSLFISNTSEDDTRDWCFTALAQLVLGYFLLPVFKAFVLASSAGVMRHWPAILADSRTKLMADIEGGEANSSSDSDSDCSSKGAESLATDGAATADLLRHQEAHADHVLTSINLVFHIASACDMSIEAFKDCLLAELQRRILKEVNIEDLQVNILLGNVLASICAEVTGSTAALSALDAVDLSDVNISGVHGHRVQQHPAHDVLQTVKIESESSFVVDIAEFPERGDSPRSHTLTLEEVASEYGETLRILKKKVYETKEKKAYARGGTVDSQQGPNTAVQISSSPSTEPDSSVRGTSAQAEETLSDTAGRITDSQAGAEAAGKGASSSPQERNIKPRAPGDPDRGTPTSNVTFDATVEHVDPEVSDDKTTKRVMWLGTIGNDSEREQDSRFLHRFNMSERMQDMVFNSGRSGTSEGSTRRSSAEPQIQRREQRSNTLKSLRDKFNVSERMQGMVFESGSSGSESHLGRSERQRKPTLTRGNSLRGKLNSESQHCSGATHCEINSTSPKECRIWCFRANGVTSRERDPVPSQKGSPDCNEAIH
eukprot:TRINITY_DN2345_c0_g1_i1.p1 TRINITY_DN2345_c0_g1~~TRINITY_DN2345_c0_g1_i1.p1  ORF type:complete len:1126 (+),score=131.87 TRINITY_DN2345_c0_g1_i1:84-3461(+)